MKWSKLLDAGRDIERLKRYASKLSKAEDVPGVLKIVSCAAHLSYHMGRGYFDHDLESLVTEQGKLHFDEIILAGGRDRWVFYDNFSLDSRGLTQQYLGALDTWGYEYLYIVDGDPGRDENREIVKQVKQNPKAQLLDISDHVDVFQKECIFRNAMIDFEPNKAFLHFAPWRADALLLWSLVKGVERFMINITDHGFWLGASCSDRIIEFRNYGGWISHNFRGKSVDDLILQKFYPIMSPSLSFEGFPDLTNGKFKIICGGSFYKMFDEPFTFFSIIAKILHQNLTAVVIVVGGGDFSVMQNHFYKLGLGDRVFFLGHRRDICEVIKNSDLFLNTYPVGGGLMMQYAIELDKIMVSFASPEIPSNDARHLYGDPFGRISFYEVDELCDDVCKIISDENYRNSREKEMKMLRSSRQDFDKDLKRKLCGETRSVFELSLLAKQDMTVQEEMYINFEELFHRQYCHIMIRWLGVGCYKIFSVFHLIYFLRSLIKRKLLGKIF